MLPNRLAVDIPTEIIARVNDIDACAEGLPVGRDTIATLTHSSFDDQGTLYVGWTRGNFRYHGSVHVDEGSRHEGSAYCAVLAKRSMGFLAVRGVWFSLEGTDYMLMQYYASGAANAGYWKLSDQVTKSCEAAFAEVSGGDKKMVVNSGFTFIEK